MRVAYSIHPSVKILLSPLKPSEFPNYDALTITLDAGQQKQSYEFLLSRNGKTLIGMTKLDLSEVPGAEIIKSIDVDGRPTRGNKNAKVVVVNYDDFQCPFCSRMHQTLFPQVFNEYGDRVAFIYKDFPLSQIHPWAMHAAVDANCLASQNNDAYWDFTDHIHANQVEVNSEKNRDGQFGALDRLALLEAQKHKLDTAKLQSCIKAQNEDLIKTSMKEGAALGVDATPTLFVNGQMVQGARSIADLRSVLDRALEQAGVPAPAHSAAALQSAAQRSAK